MRAIVVFESLWGNTEKVARAVAQELASTMSVDVVDSDSAPLSIDGYDLLVVGGPTHAFGMSRVATRQEAVQNHGLDTAPQRGIREWLATLSAVTAPVLAAAFDTRVESPRLPGSAAKAARRELKTLGFDVRAEAMTFRVHGYEGPLVDDELVNATAWAKELGTRLASVQHSA